MEFIPLVMLFSLVMSFINFLKYLRAGDANGWLTQLIVWASGIAAVSFVAQTQFASGIPIGDQVLDQLNFMSLVFVGLMIGGVAATAYELTKALDSSNSTTKPNLITNSPPKS